MSNRISLDRTVFHLQNDNSNQDEIFYGYVMTDDYGATFSMNYSEEELPIDPMEFLAAIYKRIADGTYSDRIAEEMFGHIMINGLGIYLNSVHYDWDEIKRILVKPKEDVINGNES